MRVQAWLSAELFGVSFTTEVSPVIHAHASLPVTPCYCIEALLPFNGTQVVVRAGRALENEPTQRFSIYFVWYPCVTHDLTSVAHVAVLVLDCS